MNELKAGSRPGKHDSVLKDNLIPSPAKDLDLIEKKHQQIVRGACRIFFEKGYHRTTIREIAMASGMSMGQLYHYISSKDDVLFLVYKHMQLIWYEHLVQSGVEEIGDPLDRLDKALSHTISFMMENQSLFLFVYTETKYLAKRHLKVVLEMDDKNVVGFWRRLLGDFKKEKSIEGNLDFLANLISYLMLFLPLRGWNLEDRPAPEHLTSLRNFILRGMGMRGQGLIRGDETYG
ncbi:MAG: TetR/AcrR family transcriptional regulator [Deltaproteobacteria bacterium]|nr:TetR/AcrR family transcriptional regulator [Deltaproteobacteria bacterium]